MQAVRHSQEPASLTGADWYLVQCRPGQTGRALEHLDNQGFRCFLPLLNVERVTAGRRFLREEPLFPGYLFIRLELNGQNWHTIRSTRGVRHLVGFGGKPVPVPGDVIGSLRERCDTGTDDVRPAFQRGDSLRITNGPFAELEAIFDGFDGESRVLVLLNILQKQHRLKLALKDVARH